jgi:hypothetical protein
MFLFGNRKLKIMNTGDTAVWIKKLWIEEKKEFFVKF